MSKHIEAFSFLQVTYKQVTNSLIGSGLCTTGITYRIQPHSRYAVPMCSSPIEAAGRCWLWWCCGGQCDFLIYVWRMAGKSRDGEKIQEKGESDLTDAQRVINQKGKRRRLSDWLWKEQTEGILCIWNMGGVVYISGLQLSLDCVLLMTLDQVCSALPLRGCWRISDMPTPPQPLKNGWPPQYAPLQENYHTYLHLIKIYCKPNNTKNYTESKSIVNYYLIQEL